MSIKLLFSRKKSRWEMWPGMKDYIKLTECENEQKDTSVPKQRKLI